MERILYFAYGSNMDTDTLGGRRGVALGSSGIGRAKGWRLALDKPSLLGTREGVATIVADPLAEVWGVLYEMSSHDFEHLSLTEGVLIDHYARVEIDVVARSPRSEQETQLRAVSFTSDRRVSSLRPSRRYMDLLLRGAAKHGLPGTWIEMLRAVPAEEETAESLALRPFIDSALRKPTTT